MAKMTLRQHDETAEMIHQIGLSIDVLTQYSPLQGVFDAVYDALEYVWYQRHGVRLSYALGEGRKYYGDR